MTTDQVLVLSILLLSLLVFAWDRYRVDVVALSVMVTLVLTGVLEADVALSGLSNPAVVTVLAVFILSGALVSTGVADRLASAMLKVAGTSPGRVIAVLMATCGLMSAVMNNIGATAILLPATLVVAERTGIAASKLLMPLAFASLLGGNLTAIGTPPNILANGILAQHPDLEPFAFFDFAPTGAPVFIAGIVYMAVIGRWLLPTRARSGRLSDIYQIDDYLSTVTIGTGSPLVGAALEDVAPAGSELRVLAIRHADGRRVVTPRGSTRLLAGDRLTVQATLQALAEFGHLHAGEDDLVIDDSVVSWTDPMSTSDSGEATIDVIEVMVAPESRLIGRTLTEVEFRRRWGLIALAIRGPAVGVTVAIDDVRLRAGDSIVVTGQRDRLVELFASDDFVTLHAPNIRMRRLRKAPTAVLVTVGVLATSALGLVPISIAMLTGALVLVVSGTISMEEAYSSIDWKAIFLIAGMLPLGTAMEQTGTAQLIADELVEATGGAGPLWTMLGIYALTAGITSVIANAAATVLIVPIAIDAAITLDVSPMPFVMATVIAASTAFILPIGHQVNVLVYGPGGYRFGDFARVGTGLTALVMLIVAFLVPAVWSF